MTIPADLTSAQASALSRLQAGAVLQPVGRGRYAELGHGGTVTRRYSRATAVELAGRGLAVWQDHARGHSLVLAPPAPADALLAVANFVAASAEWEDAGIIPKVN